MFHNLLRLRVFIIIRPLQLQLAPVIPQGRVIQQQEELQQLQYPMAQCES